MSWFLHLAFRVQSKDAVDCDHLAKAETEVQCMREELEASKKTQVELCKSLVKAIGGVDSA
jgi:hypothetical protein